MKEQNLIDLGFKRKDVTTEESGDNAFYYYTYDFNKYFSLITNSSDEVKKNNWFAEIFDHDIRFSSRDDLKQFIDLINKVKNEHILLT